MIQFDVHIFQSGWNHQLENFEMDLGGFFLGGSGVGEEMFTIQKSPIVGTQSSLNLPNKKSKKANWVEFLG